METNWSSREKKYCCGLKIKPGPNIIQVKSAYPLRGVQDEKGNRDEGKDIEQR
ncbi:hypothetical protein NC99_12080 [Sunxiuqinia dokdonensis]|uniref:Uncharacterized protein n=1 Tax=Sunxiuqinia dokdonensis TaxID=1409788 RepID=A0A0L8VC79_9BACT|nr:hypothetical protein NC99_12080 [Sunxiuqinia dokdonensis]